MLDRKTEGGFNVGSITVKNFVDGHEVAIDFKNENTVAVLKAKDSQEEDKVVPTTCVHPCWLNCV